MQVVTLAQLSPLVAPDQSVIREFASPMASGLQRLSIAEITLPPGVEVARHFHRETEEVYQVTSGSAQMFLDGEWQTLEVGQSVSIAPGKVHGIRNESNKPMVMIVTCSPPWSPQDQFEAE